MSLLERLNQDMKLYMKNREERQTDCRSNG